MIKICNRCGKQKSLFEFGKKIDNKDDLRSQCKSCISDYNKKYWQIMANRNVQKRYKQTHKVELAKYYRKYRKTIIGHLQSCFQSMKNRCDNPKCKSYKYYGKRGIKCLFKTANEFVDYVISVLEIDPRGLQIDRINNDGHYEPGNIRFVTQIENLKNRRKRSYKRL